jgi:hypothetical protein
MIFVAHWTATVVLLLGAAPPDRLALIGSTGRALIFAVEEESLGATPTVHRSQHLLLDAQGVLEVLDVPSVVMKSSSRLPVQHTTYLGATSSGAFGVLWLNGDLWTVEVKLRRVVRWPRMCADDPPSIIVASIGDAVACRADSRSWIYVHLPSGRRTRSERRPADIGTWDGELWAVHDDSSSMHIGRLEPERALQALPSRGMTIFGDRSLWVLDARGMVIETRLARWPIVQHVRTEVARGSQTIVFVDETPIIIRLGEANALTATRAVTRLDLLTTTAFREGRRLFVEWSDPLASPPTYAVQQVRCARGAVVAGPLSFGRVGCSNDRCVGVSRDGTPSYYAEADLHRSTGPQLGRVLGTHFFSADEAVVGVRCNGTPAGTTELECIVEAIPRLITDAGVRTARMGSGASSRIVFAEP